MNPFFCGMMEKVAKIYRDRALAIVYNEDGDILTGINFGKITIPGGGIDKGYDVVGAAKKELQEETGESASDMKKLDMKPVKLKYTKSDKYDGSRTYFAYGTTDNRSSKHPIAIFIVNYG